jgi:hypothetical protein
MFFSLSTAIVFGNNSNSKIATTSVILSNNKENKLSTEEINCLKNRVEEIRHMDKSRMSKIEKAELRNELKGIKESVRRSDQVIYIGGGTLILVIILIIILL